MKNKIFNKNDHCNDDWQKNFSPEILQEAKQAVAEKRHLDLTLDVTFKMFFTANIPESNICLCRFLSALTGRKVSRAKVINPEILPESLTSKTTRMDISCTFDNGSQADIEIQRTNESDNQKNRALFYAGKLVANALKKGQPYRNMKRAYQIMITDYIEFKEDHDDENDFYSEFEMFCRKRKITLSECQKIIFIELPKLKKIINSDFDEINPLQFWSILLKYNHNEKIKQRLLDSKLYEEDCVMADTVLDRICEDQHAWAVQLSREKYEYDEAAKAYIAREKMNRMKAKLKRAQEEIKHTQEEIRQVQEEFKLAQEEMKHTQEESLRKISKAKEAGLEQGIQKQTIALAKNFKQMGFPIDKIAAATGLSVDEIQKL